MKNHKNGYEDPVMRAPLECTNLHNDSMRLAIIIPNVLVENRETKKLTQRFPYLKISWNPEFEPIYLKTNLRREKADMEPVRKFEKKKKRKGINCHQHYHHFFQM